MLHLMRKILSLGLVVGTILCGIMCLSLPRWIIKPLQQVTDASQKVAEGDLKSLASEMGMLARGDLTGQFKIASQPLDEISQDEIGRLTLAFNTILSRLKETGQSFSRMTASLNNVLNRVNTDADGLTYTSEQLSAAAAQAGQATTQITLNIQQVARGAAEQSGSITQTNDSVDRMTEAIQDISRGVGEQDAAVKKTVSLTNRMTTALQQVAESAQTVASLSKDATFSAHSGAGIVQETVQGMERIRAKVQLSTLKVHEMGERTTRIGDILNTIDDISSQTNLLALNAAIETARAQTQATALTEAVLNRQMIAQAQLINQILCERNLNFSTDFWSDLARRAGLDTICITDRDGVIVYAEDPRLVGWKFPDDPKAQTYPFMKLLRQSDGVVCQPSQRRGVDNQVYKYVGVSRGDQPGIVQVGFKSDSLAQFEMKLGGFAVVADEVRRLAERASEATKEIGGLVKTIQKAVEAAVLAMEAGAQEVEVGSQRSSQAGQALTEILQATEEVNQQARQTSSAAGEMSASARELIQAMDSVAKVVQQNLAAARVLQADSAEVTRALEEIASISQENCAAAEQVSASTEEVNAEVEEVAGSSRALAEMAQALKQTLAQFVLKSDLLPALEDPQF